MLSTAFFNADIVFAVWSLILNFARKEILVMTTKEKYWKYSLVTIILALGLLIAIELMSFWSGLLGALTVYVLVRNQMFFLADKRHWKRSVAAGLISLEVVLCFVVPLGALSWMAVNYVQGIDFSNLSNIDPRQIIAPIEEAARTVRRSTGFNILSSETLSSAVSVLPKIGQTVMGWVSSFFVNVGVMVFVLYFMLVGGRRMENYVRGVLPFNPSDTDSVLRQIHRIIRSNAVGIPLLGLIQGMVATLGYWIFSAPNVVLFGMLTCVSTIIPIVGTSLVWVPLAAYMALTGHTLHALGVLAYGAIVVSQSDNLIRLVIQKQMADIHPLVTIFGVVVGLPLFGFMGIIFGPLLISMFLLCADIFKREYLNN